MLLCSIYGPIVAEGSSYTASRRIRTVQCRLAVLADVCVL